jgi:hypothetical protein
VSTWFPEEVTCPACGTVQLARLAHGVHVARAPEVRDQVFARTFHRIECTRCGRAFTGQRPLLYTDMDRKHWLHVALEMERPRWPELEEAAAAVFERVFATSPLAQDQREGFRMRLVFGLEELREKLVVWRAGLDDAVIECVKLDAITHAPELVSARAVIVDEVADDGGLSLVIDGSSRRAVPGAVVERYRDDPRLPSRFPELFGGRYVALHRLLGARYRWAEPR